MLKNKPIKQKVTTVIMLTSSMVFLVTCIMFVSYELVTFRRAMVENLSTLAEITAVNSSGSLAFEDRKDANEVLAALRAKPHIVAASLYDRGGILFSRYPSDIPEQAVPGGPEKDGCRFENGHLVLFHPVTQSGRRLGTLYIKSNLNAMWERFQSYGLIVILVVAVSFVVAFTLSRVLRRQITEPILALAGVAKTVSEQKDFSVRANKFGEDELGHLTDTFNQMLAQIQEQNAALKEKEERLTSALQSSRAAEAEIRRLNEGLDRRVRKRTAELEAANKELEAFSYSVSHDLRAPLRHIDGYVGRLAKAAAEKLDDKSRRYLKTISEAAREMGQLIDDLLRLSRVGRVEMLETMVDLEQLVDETAASLQTEANGRNIVWKRGPLPAVHGDPALLKQVFVNLLSNAVKYTRPRNPAEIEIGVAGEPNGEVVVFVRDNGVGFETEYADKLFGVFQRLHRADEFEGTGIGLANVRRIIQRHGGRTWAEGKVDAGATFYFSLPKTEKG